MKCEQALDRIDAYVDNELTLPERLKLQAHLDGCPLCQTELARARQLDSQCRGFEAEPPQDLRDRVAQAIQETVPDRSPIERIKETLTMKKKLGIGLGFASVAATVIAVAIVGTATMAPKPAQAASAKLIWNKMTKAATDLKAVHITSGGPMPDGTTGFARIWTDGTSLRWEMPNGQISVVVNGKLYNNGVPDLPYTDPEGNEFATAMPLTLDPEMFTLEWQLMEIGGEGDNALDYGTEEIDGRTLRKVGITSREGNERYMFWVDPDTNLPVKMSGEAMSKGKWIHTGWTYYEFIDKIDPRQLDTKGLKEVEMYENDPGAPAAGTG